MEVLGIVIDGQVVGIVIGMDAEAPKPKREFKQIKSPEMINKIIEGANTTACGETAKMLLDDGHTVFKTEVNQGGKVKTLYCIG